MEKVNILALNYFQFSHNFRIGCNSVPLKAECWEKAQLLVWNLRRETHPGCRQREAERSVLIKLLCFLGPYGRTRATQVASACVLRKAAAPAGSEHQEHVGQAAKRMETHSALLNEGWRGLKHLFFFSTEERFSVLIGGVRRAWPLTKGGLRGHHLLPFVSKLLPWAAPLGWFNVKHVGHAMAFLVWIIISLFFWMCPLLIFHSFVYRALAKGRYATLHILLRFEVKENSCSLQRLRFLHFTSKKKNQPQYVIQIGVPKLFIQELL